MSKLNHLIGNTYYIDGPTNCGLYVLGTTRDCVLIDCGTASFGPTILEILNENKLNLKYIICTHSHQDHSGANTFLVEHTGCKVIASKIERAFFRDSKLDIGFLYGGYPLEEYDSKLMHIDDQKEIYSLEEIPDGLSSFKLPGHHYGMIGVRTSDDVYFVADTLGSISLVEKQHILLIYDVQGYLNSLDYVESLDGKIIVPSHSEVTTHIKDVIKTNRSQIYEIMDVILDYLDEEHTAEEVCAYIFSYYELNITYNKYMLIMSTIRSYLSFLSNNQKLGTKFVDNKLVFYKKMNKD